jgi:dihydrofolate reductase
MISLIVAAAKNGVIGKAGSLPWYLPSELARFKQLTTSHPIVMGRKTHESIGRALPGRTNIVITTNPNYDAADCLIANSLKAALATAKQAPGSDEVFVIGGESVFAEALPLADKLYLTKVDAEIKGDRFFKFDPSQWQQVDTEPHPADAKNKYGYEFTVWEKKS